ncbi:hypothetical protein EUX98_g5951 [Antrodiella citrinella]|uniref:Phytocyanin domain-containing protein n=1 Tax=Antrodiella citrinella TaxID=2447956 RepID=A0A4V3XI85_9APHY|nr:hypothetical protein EUX98_g5951 [Antrodiella citrinella]
MRTAFFTAVLSLAAAAFAQNTTIQVQVGGDSTTSGGVFQFIPAQINATVGSVITFNFSGNPGNHTVAQSTAADPCNPLSGGFSSGFISVPAGSTGFPTWNLTVLSSEPIWFFCAQRLPSPHCYNGMVGGINVSPTNFANVQSSAKALLASFSASSTEPGVPTGALSGSGAAASAGPGPLTGSFVGESTPTGSLSIASPSSSGTPSGGSSAGGAPSPTTTPSAASMGAVVSFSAVALALLSSVVVLM